MKPPHGHLATRWTILGMFADTDVMKQDGLLWPSLFARECTERSLAVTEDELEYYERRGWLAHHAARAR